MKFRIILTRELPIRSTPRKPKIRTVISSPSTIFFECVIQYSTTENWQTLRMGQSFPSFLDLLMGTACYEWLVHLTKIGIFFSTHFVALLSTLVDLSVISSIAAQSLFKSTCFWWEQNGWKKEMRFRPPPTHFLISTLDSFDPPFFREVMQNSLSSKIQGVGHISHFHLYWKVKSNASFAAWGSIVNLWLSQFLTLVHDMVHARGWTFTTHSASLV